MALNQSVGTVRNDWFEFVESGYGLLDNKDNVGYQLIDRGESPTQKDMSGEGKNIRVYAFLAADAGKIINIQGYDENNAWIRTASGGSYIDGQNVTLVNGYVDTTKKFKSITGIRKDVTQANVQLYEITDASAPTLVDLATYEPNETLPSYRRSIIPSLGGAAGCESGTDKKVAVTVIAKLRFINAVNDTDVLMVSDLYAIKNMATAIKLEENRDFGAASEYRNLAFDSLQNQLANHMGDGLYLFYKMTNLKHTRWWWNRKLNIMAVAALAAGLGASLLKKGPKIPKYKKVDQTAEQTAAIRGNLTNFDQAKELAAKTSAADQDILMANLETAMPGIVN